MKLYLRYTYFKGKSWKSAILNEMKLPFVLHIVNRLFELLVQVTGYEVKKYMKARKTKYREENIGKIKLIKDFLPPPEKLILQEETVKVTIALSKHSVDFFKQIAKKNHTKYQKMIRVLLDQYVEMFA